MGRAMDTKLLIQVEGMSCQGCSDTLTKSLMGHQGVLAVDVDLATQTVSVQIDEQLCRIDDIGQLIEMCGFDVLSISVA